MAIETWKALVGLAVVFVAFAAIVSLSGETLSLPVAIGAFVGSIVVVGITYVMIKRGYAIGHQAGTKMRDDK